MANGLYRLLGVTPDGQATGKGPFARLGRKYLEMSGGQRADPLANPLADPGQELDPELRRNRRRINTAAGMLLR